MKPTLRALGLWLGVTTAVGLGVAACDVSGLAHQFAHLASVGFAGQLVTVAKATLLLCATWFWVSTSAVALPLVLGHAAPQRLPLCPTRLRNSLLTLCTVGLTALLLPPAAASAPDHSGEQVELVRTVEQAGPATVARTPMDTATPGAHTVTVRSGDSLWTIAERLHPGADAAELVDLTADLYTHNRHAIGADPDLIFPGTTLHTKEDTS